MKKHPRSQCTLRRNKKQRRNFWWRVTEGTYCWTIILTNHDLKTHVCCQKWTNRRPARKDAAKMSSPNFPPTYAGRKRMRGSIQNFLPHEGIFELERVFAHHCNKTKRDGKCNRVGKIVHRRLRPDVPMFAQVCDVAKRVPMLLTYDSWFQFYVSCRCQILNPNIPIVKDAKTTNLYMKVVPRWKGIVSEMNIKSRKGDLCIRCGSHWKSIPLKTQLGQNILASKALKFFTVFRFWSIQKHIVRLALYDKESTLCFIPPAAFNRSTQIV